MYHWTRAWKTSNNGITAAELYAKLSLGKAGSKSIRVLDLSPRIRTRRLRASLRVVALGQGSPVGPEKVCRISCPQYEALSYTWGESTRGGTIVLDNGVQIPITDNLHQALRRLRYWTKTRTIWVDAICINQSDTVERSGQVQMMDLIYKTASCVNIWLGEPGYVFPISRTMLRWIWKFRAQLMKLLLLRDSSTSLNPFSWHVYRLHPEALEKAMENSSPRWYDRVWVIQEYILAKNAYFCYGSRRTPSVEVWESLPVVLPAAGFDHFWTLQYRAWSTWELAKPTPNTYADLAGYGVRTVAACAAKDPRDRIYGILGFLNPDEKALVPVDYALPPWHVFAAATAASMVVQQHHEILGCVSITKRKTPDLPSWAVDFETVINMMDLGKLMPYLPIRVQHLAKTSIAHDHSSMASLVIMGHKCGTVENVVPLHNAAFNAGTDAHVTQDDSMQISKSSEYKEVSAEFVRKAESTAAGTVADITETHNNDRLDVLFLKKLASDLADADPKLLQTKLHSESMLRNAWSQTSGPRRPMEGEARNVVENWVDIVLRAPNNLYITNKTMKMGLEDLYAYALYALAASDGCCLFSTSTGLVGIAPGSICTGDLLVLGQSSNFPFLLLRPLEDHYQFRGLPMVHGLNCHLDPRAPFGRLTDLASWAGTTQERERFTIR